MDNAEELPPNEHPSKERPAASIAEPSATPRWDRSRQQRPPIKGLFWAAILIMAGLILLADNLEMLPRIGGADSWDWIMLGAGTLLLTMSFVQALFPTSEGPHGLWLIGGAVLLAMGASRIFGADISDWWPAILIIIGIGSLARAFRR